MLQIAENWHQREAEHRTTEDQLQNENHRLETELATTKEVREVYKQLSSKFCDRELEC